MRAFAVGLLIAGAGGGCFGSCRPSATQETCTPGSTAPVAALEIGANEDPFRSYNDGDTIDSVVGGQGATMVVVRLRVRGPSAPDCLAQSTHLYAADGSGDVLAQSNASLTATLALDGTRTTAPLLLPGRIPRPGEGLIITTQAGGLTVSRALSIGFSGFFDFAPSADASVDDLGD
jgi:hypothetical protein